MSNLPNMALSAFLVMIATQVSAVTAVRDAYPTLSPDGSTLLFQSNRSGHQALWIAKPDGTTPRILFDDAVLGTDPATPQWAPDGKRILFAMKPADATDNNESEIYLVNADGRTGLKRLTNAPGDDSHPHWSADGKRIFFNSARATPNLKSQWGDQWIDIYSMAADGTDIHRITDCKAICTYPWPSPDGHWIVHRRVVHAVGFDWSQSKSGGNSEIFLTSVDGKTTRNLSRDPHFDGWPTWSPDGRWIVFVSGRQGVPNSGQLYRVRPDGSGVQRITEGPFAHAQPSFGGPDTLYVYQEMEDGNSEIGGIVKLSFPKD